MRTLFRWLFVLGFGYLLICVAKDLADTKDPVCMFLSVMVILAVVLLVRAALSGDKPYGT